MKISENNKMRFDLQVIASWIEPKSKVLDLGCGTGDLLAYLKKNKQVLGTGIEQSEAKVTECIRKGLSVLQGDINNEVLDYQDHSFDYAILSQTLQQVYNPSNLIKALLRISSRVIVSFPNFSNWSIRLQVLLSGRAPKTRELPFDWHDTPNIRVITINDFRLFAKSVGFDIVKEVAINTHHHDMKGNIITFLPNLRASYGIFLIGKDNRL
jgi:methionine biosynthesis protein MetW